MLPTIRNNDRAMFDDVELRRQSVRAIPLRLPAQADVRPASRSVTRRFRSLPLRAGSAFQGPLRRRVSRALPRSHEAHLMIYLKRLLRRRAHAFLDFDVDLAPRRGMALLFQHEVRHEGYPSIRGQVRAADPT